MFFELVDQALDGESAAIYLGVAVPPVVLQFSTNE